MTDTAVMTRVDALIGESRELVRRLLARAEHQDARIHALENELTQVNQRLAMLIQAARTASPRPDARNPDLTYDPSIADPDPYDE